MQPLPSRSAPRSAVSGVGCRNGGKPAVMQPLPSRSAPRSAVSGVGCRNGGKPAVMQPLPSRTRAAVGGLGLWAAAMAGSRR